MGHLEIAEILIEQNADVNARDDQGHVPLHDTARCGHRDPVRLLFRHSGDGNSRGNDAKTPADTASTEETMKSERMGG
jgi:ankyrin repeat protein